MRLTAYPLVSGWRLGVFREQKNCGLLFKLYGSDIEIQATNFFFAPTWVKSTEKEFSIFPASKCRFPVPVFRPCMSVADSGTGNGRIAATIP